MWVSSTYIRTLILFNHSPNEWKWRLMKTNTPISLLNCILWHKIHHNLLIIIFFFGSILNVVLQLHPSLIVHAANNDTYRNYIQESRVHSMQQYDIAQIAMQCHHVWTATTKTYRHGQCWNYVMTAKNFLKTLIFLVVGSQLNQKHKM